MLQVLNCINRFMYFEVVRTVLMQDTGTSVHYILISRFLLCMIDVVSYLVDLLYDSNVEIRRLCDASLDIIAVHNPSSTPRD